MKLYPFQERMVQRSVEAMLDKQWACAVLPTGGGKTVCAAAITLQAAEAGMQVLFLVHRRELMRQAEQTLAAAGLEGRIGVIASGRTAMPGMPIQIATVQTLARRRHIQLDPGIVIVDEAHHAVSRSWSAVLDRWPNALRLGLTATPRRLDGKGLHGQFNELVVGPDINELVASGHLAPMEVLAPPSPLNLKDLGIAMGDFKTDELARRATPEVIANAVSSYEKYGRGRKAIFFAISRAHSEQTARAFREAGIRAEHVDSKSTDRERDGALARFARGETRIICNVDIISEGFDCPDCEIVIMGRPTLSYTKFIQMLGRAMRAARGKIALCLDLCGNVFIHGMPHEPQEWALKEPKRQRRPQGIMLDLVGGGASVGTCSCPRCWIIMTAGTDICPQCGQPMQEGNKVVKEINIELTAPAEQPKRTKPGKAPWREAYNALQQGEGEAGVEAVRAKYGYARGWVAVVIGQWQRRQARGRRHEAA